jgi:hypothetical protein
MSFQSQDREQAGWELELVVLTQAEQAPVAMFVVEVLP